MQNQIHASAVDPFGPYERLLNDGLHPSYDPDPASKVLSFQAPQPGERVGVFIVAGQSNAINDHTSGYGIVNTTKIDNLNPFDGAIYRASEPLLGCQTVPNPATQGNQFIVMADNLIALGVFDRVILIPVAIGATTVAQWNDQLFPAIIAGYKRAQARGFTPTAVLWQQGESDIGTSQADYVARFSTMRIKCENAGVHCPWFVAVCTWIYALAPAYVHPDVQAAQASLVNGVTVFAGPNTDLLDNSYRYDTTHFNALGRDTGGGMWANAVNAVF